MVFVLAGVALLGSLSLGLTQVQTGLPTSEQFLPKPEAIAAADRIAQPFPAGSSDPTVVITPAAEAQQVLDRVRRVSGVASASQGMRATGSPRSTSCLALRRALTTRSAR